MTNGRPQRDPRVGMVLEVGYRNAGQFLVSYSTNLSRGGLFVATAHPSGIGTVITLSLRVPGRANPIRIDASVRWIRPLATADGPAGMGLAFEGIDQVLGDHIDRLVGTAAPLRIAIVGRADHARRHLDGLVRSLLTCETEQLALDPGVDTRISRADLVIVDVDSAPDLAVEVLDMIRTDQFKRVEKVLEKLAARGSPALALCSARKVELRARLLALARVVPTPVDSQELQTRVLESLGQVAAD